MKSVHLALFVLFACNDVTDDKPFVNEQESAAAPAVAETTAGPAVSAYAHMLKGPWTKDEYPSFIWSVSDSTILFESDMLQHPYTMSGDTIIIDPLDPAQPKQKTVILKLTADLLVIRDAATGMEEQLKRMR